MPELAAELLECERNGRVLFSGLGFSLQPGQILMLEGRNGSGKTSLLRILCGIRLPDAGLVSWDGEDIFKLGPDYHEHVSYVGHRDGVKQDLTPRENLRIARSMGKPNPAVEIEDVLEFFDLYDLDDVPTRTLSAGQQRRLALGRLLVTRATLWLLDEPFTSLDRHGIDRFEKLMQEHGGAGGMVALTTHHRVALPDTKRINLSS